RGRGIEALVLGQRVVDVARGRRLVLAVSALRVDVDDGLLADPLQAHLAHDPRVDARGGHGSRSGPALAAPGAVRPAGGRGAEEEVAHGAAAAGGAGDLGED